MHLRGHRSEGLHRGRGGRDAPRERSARVHRRGQRRGLRPRPVPVRGAVLGGGDRLALDVRGRLGPDRVRRPVEAGGRVPRDLAPAPAAARPRSLPGRCLLPALPAAGARGQTVGRARRRLHDGAADHRDQGRGHLRVHPDERDLRSRMGSCSWSPSSSSRGCDPRSTWACPCPGWEAPRRRRR